MGERLLGEHFNRDGNPKRAYPSESVARAEAARFNKAFYRCDFCGKFHLATDESLRRKRL